MKLHVPRPPERWIERGGAFRPDQSIDRFVRRHILDERGDLFNVDHVHLETAAIGYLWTKAANSRRGRQIVGEAEIPAYRVGKWQRARLESQLRDWFGEIPDFVVTFDAVARLEMSDLQFLAILEHEIYHCGQAVDEFGFPKFRRDSGLPVFAMRGHDVEEFAGVIRRYGVGNVGQDVRDMVEAAISTPELDIERVSMLCGSCIS